MPSKTIFIKNIIGNSEKNQKRQKSSIKMTRTTMFEIRRVFTEHRAEISKVNEEDPATASHTMAKGVRELGLDQIKDNLHNMLQKEAGVHPSQRRCLNNLQYNPVDYLNQNFNGTVSEKLR